MLITDRKTLERFDSPHRIWQGIPGIAKTSAGRVFISYYSGGTREALGNFCLLSESRENGFSEPIAAAYKEGPFRCFDPGLWIDPLGRLWLFWSVMPGEEVFAVICEHPDDKTLVWSEEFYIGRGVMLNKPTVLSTGEWVFPIAFWDRELMGEVRAQDIRPDDRAGAYAYVSSDNGKTFALRGHAEIRDKMFHEHMIAEQNDGSLRMLLRTSYGIAQSFSPDRGKTWSVEEDSRLGGPCSRFFYGKLSSGRVLLINHVNYTGRNNLTALLSEDDGKTFPYSLLLDERRDVSYPDAVETSGVIDIVYDRERGGFKKSLKEATACAREILLARVTEDDILSGRLTSDGYLKRVALKLGAFDGEDPFPLT